MKSAIERRMEIANIVGLQGKAYVEELSKLFNVSGSTIRADLRFLEQGGFIIRSHGVAIINKGPVSKFATKPHADFTQVQSERSSAAEFEKGEKHDLSFIDSIGGILQTLLKSNDTVFMDGHDMIRQAMKAVPDLGPVVVMTNDINLMSNLIHHKNIKVIMPGGIVEPESMKFVGSQVLSNLKRYRFNKSVIKVDGFNKKLGFFAKSEFEADMVKLLCELSEEVIVVTESKQLTSSSTFWIGDIDIIDTLITDQGISQDHIDYFETNSVKVIMSKE
ncbi:DeoR/GlpR family DNA-binding transcription regulator [uncultured Photobacterium sp.]|uniref:DeoR/GlpR family DNA-binding transcription regulator n=1 Tax=uncultured Photobacterium sp. TaxID=173973 RepID=UPI0026286E5E|nr:DeoR/GlpR family DNA-binding transcription regulator [uncultured Photobacterium sp.]